MNADMNADTQVVETRSAGERITVTNPFEPGPNFDPARAAALLHSDTELAAYLRDAVLGGQV